jgi:hypothetical protein
LGPGTLQIRFCYGSGDLFLAQLDQIITMKHELVQLADKLD